MTNDLARLDEPKPTATPVDKDTADFLAATSIVEAINKALPQGVRGLPPIPKDYVFKKRDRETVSVAIHAAFELSGGVPGLIQWAASHPTEFYQLWSKLLGSETQTGAGGTTININSNLPSNPLDLVNVDEHGNVFTLDDELPE